MVAGVDLSGETQASPSRQQVFAHRLPRVDWIRSPTGGGFNGLVLQISVDGQGTVTSAEVTEGPSEFREEAPKLARSWKYKPFEQNRTPQAVVFTDFVSILPPERPADLSVAFPAVHDWAGVRITLKRTPCYGDCPGYELQILGNGDVFFQGSFRRSWNITKICRLRNWSAWLLFSGLPTITACNGNTFCVLPTCPLASRRFRSTVRVCR